MGFLTQRVGAFADNVSRQHKGRLHSRSINLFASLFIAAVFAGGLIISPASAQDTGTSAQAQEIFFEAFELYRTGRLKDAAARFREGLRLDQSNARGWLILGDVLVDSGQLREARLAYENAVQNGDAEIQGAASGKLNGLPIALNDRPRKPAPDRAKARESLTTAAKLFLERRKTSKVFYGLGASLLPETLLAEAQISAGDVSGALELVNQLVAVDPSFKLPNSSDSQLELGARNAEFMTALLVKAGSTQQAVAMARRCENLAQAILDLPRASNDQFDRRRERGVYSLARAAMAYRAVNDLDSANRVYKQAMSELMRLDESQHSGVRAKVAIIRLQAGDVDGALAMEGLVKQRHPRFYVGHSWHEVMDAMAKPLISEGRYADAANLIARGGDGTGISASYGYLKVVQQAIKDADLPAGEAILASITDNSKRAEAIYLLGKAYALRRDAKNLARMLDRMRSIPTNDARSYLIPLLVASGAAASAEGLVPTTAGYARDRALSALAEGYALARDWEKAFAATGALKTEHEQQSAYQMMAIVSAWSDTDYAARIIKTAELKAYHVGGVLESRVQVWDFDGARRLAKDLGDDPEILGALGQAFAKAGYWDEALKYTAGNMNNADFWLMVGRAQAGLPTRDR